MVLIGITDCGKFGNYEKWIKSDPGIQVIKLGYKENNFSEIKKCNGILLTGGQDIHPRFYNEPEYLEFCDPKDVDEKRDEFEWNVLEYTMDQRLPLLGICRGLQMTNVFLGGTLIPDIPSFGKSEHSKDQGSDRYHDVQVIQNSTLGKIVNAGNGIVNSAHHQSADRIGKDLVVNAISDDEIIEGLEKKDDSGPFFLLVQWHPERMKDLESSFSKNIRENFLQAAGSI